jgi:hypothetical protein
MPNETKKRSRHLIRKQWAKAKLILNPIATHILNELYNEN